MIQTAKMTDLLHREDLDRRPCPDPKCNQVHDEVGINPVCHPGAPTRVEYVRDDGVVRIRCAVCGACVCGIAVAAMH